MLRRTEIAFAVDKMKPTEKSRGNWFSKTFQQHVPRSYACAYQRQNSVKIFKPEMRRNCCNGWKVEVFHVH